MSSINPIHLQKAPAFSNAFINPPLYLIHDGSSTIANYTKLGKLNCDVYGIQDPNFRTGKIWAGGLVEMAQHYIALIEKTTPRGAVILGGWCFGGIIAIQLAYELRGHPMLDICGVMLMDVFRPSGPVPKEDMNTYPTLAAITNPIVRNLVAKSFERNIHMLRCWVFPFCKSSKNKPQTKDHVRGPFVVLIRAKDKDDTVNPLVPKVEELREHRYLGWEHCGVEFITKLVEVEGSHNSMFDPDHVDALTRSVRDSLQLIRESLG